MFLKKVEVYGFKSFANKVTFDFSEGITGFVGPNGCGKSNVVDAIKWGLGEQRVSSLRGDSMQDVIFKGNGRRPPQNFAEVSLYFSNDCGTLPIDYDEVVITRRLYRSSESEYLLNRTPCRLKDIRGLFLDTGIGVNAYSMMEQGKIDSILQADAVSRRAIFEEASGISRFKSRRKEAERKLERTQANLLRAGDIIEELERRIRSLKNQAGRARSYLKYSDRLKELKQDFFLYQYRRLMDEAREIEARKVEAQGEADRQAQAHRSGKEEAARLEKEIELMGEDLLSKKTDLTEARTSLEETEGRIGYFEKRSHELERERGETGEREEELNAALELKRADLNEIRARFEALKREERQIADEESLCAGREARLEAEWKKALDGMEALEGRSLVCTRKEVDLKNRTVETEAGFKAAHLGLVRMARRQNDMARDLHDVSVDLARVETEQRVKEKARADLLSSLQVGREKALEAEDGLRVLESELKRIESEIIKRDSRMDVLQNLLERREGVGSGVKAVLDEARKPDSPLHFVKGMLGELFEVDVSHSAALEAALGLRAEALVVEDPDQARLVMEFLSRKERGRVTLLVLSTYDEVSSPEVDEEHLIGHVVCRDPALKKAVGALLGEVLIVERNALLAGRGSPSVTLDGDFLDGSGMLFVGGTAPEPGVISRRSELAALGAEREGLSAERDALLGRRGTHEAEFKKVRLANEEISSHIERQTDALSATHGEREKHFERFSHLRREYALNVLDQYEMEMSIQSQKGTLHTMEQEMQTLSQEMASLCEELTAARNEVQTRSADREQLARKRNDLEFQRIKFLERREGVEKELALIEKNLEEVNQRLAEMVRSKERLASMQSDMEHQVAEMKGRVGSLVEKRSLLSEAVSELQSRLERVRQVFDTGKAEAERMESAVEEARQKVDELRIEERGNEVKREGLVDKAREELELELCEDAQTPATEERDWDSVEAEISEIRNRLARMGHVNLEAIDELEEVEDRYTALVAQREDLVKSIKSLEELIADLNRESREKFVQTFESVRTHFNEIFRKLFQGGRADVRLKEGEDVLEAGIEIIAGPPGKDVRSISLLSGGERTLTATGLLFALFKSRPSPFCILDEVDAALDETNIERFCNLLGEYVQDSQFMIVTHSKRTMSYCDYLYGITMQEDGVTTNISLNLEAYEDQVA